MIHPKIVFENSHWVAVDKPALWLTVPSRLGASETRPILGLWLESHLKRRVWPVHRLDFEVSGLVLFALDAEAHRSSQKWFESHSVRKIYEAWTTPPQDLQTGQEFCWRSKIVRGKKRSFVAEHGLPAETLVTFEGEIDQCGRWRLEPRTGRSHQLRLEMSRHHFEILGDSLYGGATWPYEGIALRARQIVLSTNEFHENRFDFPESIEVPDLQSTLSPSK